jgi:hypothetical protein
MTSDWLVVVQALAAAVSAATAAYLVYVTLGRDRDAREERERDHEHEQLRRLVDGLRSLHRAMRDGTELDFEVAQAEVAVATALRLTLEFQACLSLADDDMPRPPYALGQSEPWSRLEAALDEVRRYALEEAAGHPAS